MIDKISFEDLVIAYRKAKADCFYEKGHNTSIAFATYEASLYENLGILHKHIKNLEPSPHLYEEFGGGSELVLKSMKATNDSLNYLQDQSFIYHSNQKLLWENENTKNYEYDFRIIGKLPVDLHILSSLWIDKVGYKLESMILNNSSYGCRLKRPFNQKQFFEGSSFDFENLSQTDPLQLGHFVSYYNAYKKWQTDGLSAIKKILKEDKKAIALTTDIKKFYHRIDPSFLIDEKFREYFGLPAYTVIEDRLTRILINALENWSSSVFEDNSTPTVFKEPGHCGIPLGLGCSKVIANLLLAYFDNEINSNVMPVFYGRYIDDIFIVIEDRGNIRSSKDFWNFLGQRISGIELLPDAKGNKLVIPYSSKSLLEFVTKKEKVFFLEGSSGSTLIEKLEKTLADNSSEWKLLPDSEEDLNSLSKEIANAFNPEEEQISGLRRSDGISIQRLKFALHLRNFEAIIEMVPKAIWINALKTLVFLAKDFIITPKQIATYSVYYPRLLSLAVKAKEPLIAFEIWKAINEAWHNLLHLSHRKYNFFFQRCISYSNDLLFEALVKSIDPLSTKERDERWEILFSMAGNHKLIKDLTERLFFSDLHQTPFKRMFLDVGLRRISELIKPEYVINFSEKKLIIKYDNYNLLNQLFITIWPQTHSLSEEFLRRVIPKSLFFYTRPFDRLELTQLFPDWATSANRIGELNQYFILFNIHPLTENIVNHSVENGQSDYVQINVEGLFETNNRVFALTSFETKNKSWVSWVRDDNVEPDESRYNRLFKLINDVLQCKKEINYLVLPELSVPRNIINLIARRLKSKNISLIAGTEYHKRNSLTFGIPNIKGLVSNHLVYILSVKVNNQIEQIQIVQEKTVPAQKEESELFSVGGKIMYPTSELKYIINHSKFVFSGLICNDLLNIDYRQNLRGKIDALVVVEWNKDVDTYDALVQSTSSDLHCFVLQVNNRLYGDTRLRGPYKESYLRDMVRVRGGELDYFVVATLNVDALREFQRNHRSPEEPFKPIPTGFKISELRRKF